MLSVVVPMTLHDKFYLSDNPFGTVPGKNLVWADFEDYREELTSALRFAFSGSPSRIIACIYGTYGAGKTHTMNYFCQPEIIAEVAGPYVREQSRLPIFVPVLYPSTDTAKSLYVSVLRQIGIGTIRRAVETIVSPGKMVRYVGAGSKDLAAVIQDDYLGRALSKIGDEKMPVERYLLGRVSVKDQERLEVPRPIETYDERINTLAGILRLLVNTVTERFVIWIDDAERVGEGSGKDMFEFQHLIRDLLDKVSDRLLVVMNFTLTPGTDLGERLNLLGQAIVSRISRVLMVPVFDTLRFLKYVSDLLRACRADSAAGKSIGEYHPFTEESLTFVYQTLSRKERLTPRDLNGELSTIMENALTTPRAVRKDGTIDALFIRRYCDRLLSI